MELKDFKIGMLFKTDSGIWKVTDIGSKTIIAYNTSIATNDDWDVQHNIIWYSYDFGGCSLVKEDK